MNCPINVVSNAQIAFKQLILQARPANALMTVHAHRLVQPQVSMGTGASNGRCSDFTNQRLALSFRRQDYPAILHIALSPIHKYRSEPSLYF